MWQSHVGIEIHSVAYFDRIASHRIAAFKAPYRGTSVKGGVQRHFVDSSCIYEARMSPTLNGSSVIRRFKHRNAIKIRNGM